MSDAAFKKDLLKFGGINATTGNMYLQGNIRMLGNGSFLQQVTVDQLIVSGNAEIPGLSFDSLTVSGNVTAGGYFVGNGYYLTLNGLTLIPQGNVANISQRLELNVPAGTLVTQEDNGLQYLLTALPPDSNSNWLQFTGTNFPVPSVFGRTGAITASINDYTDSFIQLSANIGTATTNDHVSDALAYLNTSKANIANGAVTAGLVGNVIGAYANVVNIIAVQGNVGNTQFLGGNVAVSGQVNVLGNVVGQYFVGNGSQLTGLLSGLPATANIDIRGNVTAPGNVVVAGQVNVTGNVVGQYFVGNGSQLTGLLSGLPATANIDIRGNVTAPGNVTVAGQVNVTGNVVGQYFIGNGALLSSITLPATANIDIRGNVTAVNVTTGNLTVNTNAVVSGLLSVAGNVTSGGYFVGNGYYLTLNGLTLIPQGNVANVSQRLALTVPAGALVTQEDNNLQYLLTALPANSNSNWLQFTGANFPVPSVFGRTGAVTASINDYNDSFIQLSANIGTATTNDHVSDALAYLNTGKANIANGTVTAGLVGNVIGAYANVANINAVAGNVGNTRFLGGNVAVSGQVNVTGNVVGQYFVGNGSQLTGLLSGLPATANIDIRGNVTAPGNVVVAGQVNVTGNVAASYFTGNGALLTGIVVNGTIPARYLSATRSNNQAWTGTWANTNIIMNTLQESSGITYNTTTGIFTLDAGVTYRITSQLTWDAGTIPFVAGHRVVNSANDAQIGQQSSRMYSMTFDTEDTSSSVLDFIVTPSSTTSYRLKTTPSTNAAAGESIRGNASFLTVVGLGSGFMSNMLPSTGNIDIIGNVIGSYANVANIIAVQGNVGNTRFLGGNVAVSGQVNVLGNVVGQYFVGNGSQLTGLLSGLPATGNIDIRGNVTAPGNVVVAGQVNVTGNVAASYFTGNGALLTGIVVNGTTPARYLSAGRSTDQTSGGAWANTNIIMNSVRESSGITYNSTTGVFTLEGGVTYRITAQLQWLAGASYFFGFRLVNSTTGVQIGPQAESISMANSTNNSSGPVLDLIVTPSVTTDYRLRMGLATAANSGEVIRADSGTFLTIVGLGSGFTSGLPSTGNIDILGNVIGSYANVANIIAVAGNVGNIRMSGGNVAVSGQVNVLGNVVAPFFIGNGSQLTGLTASTSTSLVNGNSNVIVVNNGNISMSVAGVSNVFSLNNNSLTINGNIFDSIGQVYGTPASYARYARTATQAVTAASNVIVFTSTESSFGTDISLNTSTGVITLAAGKTYRLRGYAGYFTPTSGIYFAYRWYNITTGAYIGSTAHITSPTSGSSATGAAGTAEAIITPAVTTTVRLDTETDGTIGVVVSGLQGALYPWADVQVIGGQIPFTSIGNLIATQGNVGNTRLVGGNVAVSGQVNVLGNVVASNFIGNVIGLSGNIGNTRFLGGNVAISGQVNILGNTVLTGPVTIASRQIMPSFVGCKYLGNGFTTSTPGTYANIPFSGTQVFDPLNLYNANTSLFTCPFSGYYTYTFTVFALANTTYGFTRVSLISSNVSTVQSTILTPGNLSATLLHTGTALASAGDTLLFQSTGSTANIQATGANFLSVYMLAATS
jgi:cytoskeletal protein CcmA (bactofilin family)